MAYASIEGDNSHRQNKAFKQRLKVCLDSDFLKTAYELADARLKQTLMAESQIKEFKQRLKYRLEQGCSLEDAFELASLKLRLVHVAQSSQHPDENNPQKNDQRISMFRLSVDEKASDENSSGKQKAFHVSVSAEPTKDEILPLEEASGHRCGDEKSSENISSDDSIGISKIHSYEPTKEEVRLVKEELIRKRLMTEIPPETNSTEAAPYSSAHSSATSAPNGHSKDLALALDGLSGMIAIWLVLSMTFALPGAWYSTFPIAMAVEFTPLLVFRAKINVERRWIPDLFGVLIFSLGLLLYLVPSAQTVWNETREYSSSLARYAHDASAFEEAQSRIGKAKIKSDNSEANYQATLKASGLTSWKTDKAKKVADDDSSALKDRIAEKAQISFPVAPKISGELTEAAQTVATRIILFGAMFLLMFVRRKL